VGIIIVGTILFLIVVLIWMFYELNQTRKRAIKRAENIQSITNNVEKIALLLETKK